MDPYSVRAGEFATDPHYAPLNFRIFTVKIIPVVGEDAIIFPSWEERKLVWLELVFNPFTLETVILLHKSKNIQIVQGRPWGNGKADGVVICSSFFTPVMTSETQRHVVLYRNKGVQDKILAFYDNPLPATTLRPLTRKIADRFLATLVATKKEETPSLELCFDSNADVKTFFYAWQKVFGRAVDTTLHRKCKDVLGLSEELYHKDGPIPPLNSIPRYHFGTPVSLQTPTIAGGLILAPSLFEKVLSLTETNLALQEPVFKNLKCHDYYHSIRGKNRVLEIFVPQDKLLECQMFKHPKLIWRVTITPILTDGTLSKPIRMKIEDMTRIVLREPLLPLLGRQKYISTLKQDEKVKEWINENEKGEYWWLKLLFPYRDYPTEETLKLINIKFEPLKNNAVFQCASSYLRSRLAFNPQKAFIIECIYLGHRLGRMLPNSTVKETNIEPPMSLFGEQARAFYHVRRHDFTLVDGAPGTGKTTLVTEIVKALLLWGGQVIVMATTEVALDGLAIKILNALPHGEFLASGAVVRLRPATAWKEKPSNDHKKRILETIRVDVKNTSYTAPEALDLQPQAAVARGRIDRASLILMTTKIAEVLDPFYGVSGRTFDLLVVDDANTCSESVALQLTERPVANALRWLVIGCSKGITPRTNIDEFERKEVAGSWFNRLLRHPEFRINPLRLTMQGRLRKPLYEPINRMFYRGTIKSTSGTPYEQSDYHLCMGFISSSKMCSITKGTPEDEDEELSEVINYRKEQRYVFSIVQKIYDLMPHAKIVIMCQTEPQRVLLDFALKWFRELEAATIFIETVDSFADREADYAVIHIPFWKGSYKYTDDPGRFVIAMTRARKGVFVVGDLDSLTEYEKKRDRWAENPWRNWLFEVNRSAHGAVFEGVAELDLTVDVRELAFFKRKKMEKGLWSKQGYSKEEQARLRGCW